MDYSECRKLDTIDYMVDYSGCYRLNGGLHWVL